MNATDNQNESNQSTNTNAAKELNNLFPEHSKAMESVNDCIGDISNIYDDGDRSVNANYSKNSLGSIRPLKSLSRMRSIRPAAINNVDTAIFSLKKTIK